MARNTTKQPAYKAEYATQVYKLRLLGATRKEISNFFEITDATLSRWIKTKPEFAKEYKRGGDYADASVAEKLYQRAIGYSHPEDKVFQYQGEPIVVPTVKHYPPDTAAGIFWLTVRQNEKWRKPDDTGGGSDIGPRTIDPAKMSTEALKELVAARESNSTD